MEIVMTLTEDEMVVLRNAVADARFHTLTSASRHTNQGNTETAEAYREDAVKYEQMGMRLERVVQTQMPRVVAWEKADACTTTD